jgi:branched-chain amino acid transport system ATP-binding protein
MSAVLEVRDLRARYGAIQVLHDVDFDVEDGEIVVILGANGAGKTTTLRAICGMVATQGSIRLHGEEISKTPTATIVRKGVAHVPQGRGTFPELTVEENLEAGGFIRTDDLRADVDKWCEVFPALAQRRRQQAGSLSGGEQQMLAVARALMSRPRLLLLDEPSLGLAPLIIEDLFTRLSDINREEGVTMLIVEQNADLALGVAARGFVIEAGHTVLSGTAAELADDEAVRRAYLGS